MAGSSCGIGGGGHPLMVQSSRAALANVDPVLENAARTLGASELRIFWRVTLPLARRGIWRA